ncbi:MAG TPA: glycosyltransferase, partial [Ignavibacteriales bacterium]|nr:glycosyltransferase [Ignavibacteriales bacterium]
ESVAAVGPISNYVAGLQRMDLYLRKIPKVYSIDQIADMNYEANKGRSAETKLLIGFCLAARRDVLDKLGYLDEELFLGNDDLELSWRLRLNGYKLKVATDTFIYHEGQHSFNTEAKTTTSKLVQESTNALYAKLQKYYGEDNIPSPMELWMVNWFNAENAKYNPKSRLEDVKPEFRNGYVKKEKLTSIIILTYNQLEYTRKCVDSIIKYTPEKYEIIFVDNASADGTPKYLEGLKTKNANIKLIKNDANLGFPKAVNQGIKAAEGEYILVANNDIHATEGWLSSLINKIELKNEYGIAGPLSNKVSGFQIDKNAKYDTDAQMLKYAANLSRTNKDKYFEFPRVAFLCTLIKREVIDKVGGLDERFTPGNYEDDDYCLRAQKAGYKTIIVQDAFIHHYGSKSFTADGMAKYAERLRINRDIFVDKWGADPDEIWIKGKPIKNRNYAYPLSLNIGDEAYNRAKILFEDGDYNWAKAELKKAFEVCTNGHLEKCYELAAQIDAMAGGESSSSFSELFNEGYRLFSESNFAEAIDKFDQAKRFRNDSSLITNEELSIISGAAYLNIQAYDKAANEFKSAVEQNSSSAKAYEGLGECYFLMDDFGAAKEMFGKTLSLEEENKNALNKMKLINERLKGK